MTSLETRYPCPVCLGVTLEKVRVALPPAGRDVSAPEQRGLVLDHCTRCGGVWFEHGEVQQLRRVDPQALWAAIAKRDSVHLMQCHSCHAHVARSEKACAACNWNIRLDCPVCQRSMERTENVGLILDVCRSCKGVWFDHDELAVIWKLQVHALVQQRRHATGDMAVGSLVLLDALTYDPFIAYYGIRAAGFAIGGAAAAISHVPGALANAPEAVAGLAGAAGEAASSVFETIVEIISGFFN